jgi:hypothetical protein
VFGCKAFVQFPRNEMSKLDEKSKQCLFMGCGHEEFDYRLRDPVTKKIIRSHGVIFLKTKPLKILIKPRNKHLMLKVTLILYLNLPIQFSLMGEMYK